jgi:hypothetical protein
VGLAEEALRLLQGLPDPRGKCYLHGLLFLRSDRKTSLRKF